MDNLYVLSGKMPSRTSSSIMIEMFGKGKIVCPFEITFTIDKRINFQNIFIE